MTETTAFSTTPSFTIREQPEAFPLLPALAERLGVKPGRGDGRVVMTMKDGTSYDLFALINAFLDKIEAGSRAA